MIKIKWASRKHFCLPILLRTIKSKKQPDWVAFFGAGNQNRTDDLVITNDVLYRLSHTSACDFVIIPNQNAFVNPFFENIFVFSIFLSFFRPLLTHCDKLCYNTYRNYKKEGLQTWKKRSPKSSPWMRRQQKK